MTNKKTKSTESVEVFVRPSYFPDWALNDVLDPTEQTYNVIEPPSEKKQVGWIPREVVPNNFMNWIHRITNNWLKYLDQQLPLPTLTAEKPLASTTLAGKIIYIADLGEGGTMAFSDGVNWRKISDNSIITE